jgi:hypothetical protein
LMLVKSSKHRHTPAYGLHTPRLEHIVNSTKMIMVLTVIDLKYKVLFKTDYAIYHLFQYIKKHILEKYNFQLLLIQSYKIVITSYLAV